MRSITQYSELSTQYSDSFYRRPNHEPRVVRVVADGLHGEAGESVETAEVSVEALEGDALRLDAFGGDGEGEAVALGLVADELHGVAHFLGHRIPFADEEHGRFFVGLADYEVRRAAVDRVGGVELRHRIAVSLLLQQLHERTRVVDQ